MSQKEKWLATALFVAVCLCFLSLLTLESQQQSCGEQVLNERIRAGYERHDVLVDERINALAQKVTTLEGRK